jgi:hypothetical protein
MTHDRNGEGPVFGRAERGRFQICERRGRLTRMVKELSRELHTVKTERGVRW